LPPGPAVPLVPPPRTLPPPPLPLPVGDVEAPSPCEPEPPALPLALLPLPLPAFPDEPLACEPELEPPLLLEDDPLSRELEPPPPLLEDGALSCELEPPPLLLLEDGALSCELEPPPLLPLLLLEDGALSCELEPLLLPLLLLLEDDALSCEGALDALSEPPGCANAGVPPATISASSAVQLKSTAVLLRTTLVTRWSCDRFRGVDSHRAFMSDLLSVRSPTAGRPGRRRGGPPSPRRDRRSG
jgi:hypothetical protein